MHFEDVMCAFLCLDILAHFAIARKKIATRALYLNIACTDFHALNFTKHAT
jgi:hypothetical protein